MCFQVMSSGFQILWAITYAGVGFGDAAIITEKKESHFFSYKYSFFHIPVGPLASSMAHWL